MRRILYILINLLWIGNLLAQNVLFPGYPKIFFYSKEHYNASRQNWDAIQDDRGFIYFANSNGVLVYDGVNWQLVPLPHLPIARAVDISKSGKIYTCGYNNFGYLSADSIGNFKFISLIDSNSALSQQGTIWDLIAYQDYIFLYTDDSLYFYHEPTKRFKSFYIKGFFPEINTVYDSLYVPTDSLLLLFDPKTEQFKKSFIPQKLNLPRSPDFIIPAFNDKIAIFIDTIVWITDKNLNTIRKGVLPYYPYAYASSNDYLFLNLHDKGLLILDSNLNIVYRLDKTSGLPMNMLYFIYYDSYDNLWISSDLGLNYIILNTPFSYLDKAVGNVNVVYSSIFSKYLFIGLSFMVKYIKTEDLFDPMVANKTAYTAKNLYGQSWNLFTLDTIAYIPHNTDIIQLHPDLSHKTIRVDYANVWGLDTLPGKQIALIYSVKGLYWAKIHNNQLQNIRKIEQVKGEVRDLITTKNGEFWFLCYKTDKLIRAKLDTANNRLKIIHTYGAESGLKTIYGNDLIYDPFDDRVFINNGNTIKVFNPKTEKFDVYKPITKYFDPQVELYLMGIDSRGGFWVNIVDYRQLPALKYRTVLFSRIAKDKLLYRKLTTGSLVSRDYMIRLFSYKNRYVFLSTTRGPVIFDYNKKFNLKTQNFKVYIRAITSGEQTLWGGNTVKDGKLTSQLPETLEIPYKHNSVVFHVAAPFFENSDYIQYSYMLEQWDKTWQPWTTDAKKEYTYLREGTYTFKVKAKNIYGIETPVVTFKFRILPPWYRSTLAWIVYLLLAAGLIYLIILAYSYNLRKKNERLEELVRQRTREIEMKNAELEQQKEEIQAQADELAQINRELERLSLIVQKTDNAVILTDAKGNFIWVNPAFTKIFGYTLEELIQEISPNIIGKRTDPKVRQLIQKAFEQKVTVEYEAQYRTKDGKTIWVHTTLTPILDEQNNIVGMIAIDSDITKLKLAEEKIRIQNENIKGSIRYAQVIQKSILPLKEEIDQYFDSFIIYIPRDIVSGDFYWMSKKFSQFTPGMSCKSSNPQFAVGDYLLFAVVDCTGHGVPGAFMSLIGNRLLENIVNQYRIHDPEVVLKIMDQRLAEIFKHTDETHRDGMVVALCRFDKVCQNNKPIIKVTFAGAKLNILHYSAKQHSLIEYKGTRKTIGQFGFNRLEFSSTTFFAEQDDIIFTYTDGYKDQNNIERRRIGLNRFKNLLLQYANLPMDQIKEKLEQFLYNWMKGTEQRDDITVIGLKMKQL